MYCTVDDLKILCSEADLVQLSNDDPTATTIDQDNVDGAISNASELIDGFLRGRYNLPLPTASKIVEKIAVDLSIYELYRRRISIKMPDQVADSYKNAMKLLEKIQNGGISLGYESNDAVSPSKIQINKTAEDRLFPKDTLELY